MFSTICLRFFLEHLRLDRSVERIEWVHYEFYVCFIHFIEEILDAIIIAIIVHHYKARMTGRNKCRNKPLIEFID